MPGGGYLNERIPGVQNKAQDDDLVMSLVELALARRRDERESYLRSACAQDSQLLEEVRKYVDWDERMGGFLLDPLYRLPPDQQAFEPGDLLDGRFRIVREVAQGGMGVVYEAVDEKLNCRIAVKFAKTGFRKRLPPEVRHAREIAHPNVCKIFEINTVSTPHGEIDFLTMEFLEGETLAERLRHGPLPEEPARTIAQQLCSGLAEAHRNQVIHGDLKSNNVILTRAANGTIRAVITDFGLARRPEDTQPNGQSAPLGGTPDYMAPELWKGQKATVASDLYALGVILYELASGERPFLSSTESPWEERLTRKPPAVDPKWAAVDRLLDPDPARRFHSADEVAHALAPRSRRWILAAAAAVVLAAISGIVTYQGATAPAETVRLALLPFEADRGTAPVVERLLRDSAAQLSRLKSTPRTQFRIIPLNQVLRNHVDTNAKARRVVGATHTLHVTLASQNGKILLHADLADARSGAKAKEWQAVYAPAEIRYTAAALAGVVTLTFRLPALAASPNTAAQRDYLAGVSSIRRDSGIDHALLSLERAVGADPDSPLTFAALAEAQWFKYYASRDRVWLDRATESARQAGLRNPDLAPVHRIAGLLLYNSGWYEQAVAEYSRAIELEPGSGAAYRRLGQAYERNNQLSEALAAYTRAIAVDPQDYRSYQALGSFYFERANYGEAVKHLRKEVDLAPEEPNAHFALGSAYLDLGRLVDAETEFRMAVHLEETSTALERLGVVLLYEERDAEAVTYLSRATALSPEGYLPWMNVATAYRRMHWKAESDQANRRALELAEKEMTQDPRNGKIRSHLAYLCARLGNARRAESEITQALRLSPYDSNTRWMAAATYEALDQRDATLAVLSGAPDGVIADLSRWPDVAELNHDPRFLQLLASRAVK